MYKMEVSIENCHSKFFIYATKKKRKIEKVIRKLSWSFL